MSSLQEKVELAIWRTEGPAITPEQCRRYAEAAMSALYPVEAVEHLEPVILYFPDAAKREQFIEAIKEAKPSILTVRV